jgi:hypothetical protein
MGSGVPVISAWAVHGEAIVKMAYEVEVVCTTAVSRFHPECEMSTLFAV